MYHELLNYFEAKHKASLITFCDPDDELTRIFFKQTELQHLTSKLLELKPMQELLYAFPDGDDARADVWAIFLLFAHHLLP
jgi:hypothetical protein